MKPSFDVPAQPAHPPMDDVDIDKVFYSVGALRAAIAEVPDDAHVIGLLYPGLGMNTNLAIYGVLKERDSVEGPIMRIQLEMVAYNV